MTDALRRVAAGGTVLDPQVVAQLFAASRDPLDASRQHFPRCSGLAPSDSDHRRVMAVLTCLRL